MLPAKSHTPAIFVPTFYDHPVSMSCQLSLLAHLRDGITEASFSAAKRRHRKGKINNVFICLIYFHVIELAALSPGDIGRDLLEVLLRLLEETEKKGVVVWGFFGRLVLRQDKLIYAKA